MLPKVIDLASLRGIYASGKLTPVDLALMLAQRIAAYHDTAVFITALPRDDLVAAAKDLVARHSEPNSLPLWGIPFAVKDNIDVAGLPTTAACPAFAYIPERDAFVVERLKAAGALVVGKTNLDQFATGLNGTRSPYGAPRSVFSERHISGGSSSGSAVAVAAGLASFALGTDTAGSGRVPAAFNNLVGIKPTPGRLSASGVVPACRSLDCVSIFAATVADGLIIRREAEAFDPTDSYSRRAVRRPAPDHPRVGVLAEADREFFGDAETARLYERAISSVDEFGATTMEIDYAPFRETAALLYEGPWVAERFAAVETFLTKNAARFDPSVLLIIEGARRFSAAETFRALYKLEDLKRRVEAIWGNVDVLLLPTAPTTYTVAQMRDDPIPLNSRLGHYTNFTNLLGLAAIAVPAGFRSDGLPMGVTVIGQPDRDDALAALADAVHRAAGCGFGIDRGARLPTAQLSSPNDGFVELAVVGAHLSGLPLNHELVSLGATFLRSAKTASDYRLYALPDTNPAKPGLVREPGFTGPGIAIEVWSLPEAAFARFVSRIPSPLGIGKIHLDDRTLVSGFLCEAHGVEGAADVTEHGGWRAYLNQC